jgi:hypothetical protein
MFTHQVYNPLLEQVRWKVWGGLLSCISLSLWDDLSTERKNSFIPEGVDETILCGCDQPVSPLGIVLECIAKHDLLARGYYKMYSAQNVTTVVLPHIEHMGFT